ncbi:MAG: exosortase/archaeosortase family protein [Akkermansia sp.]|nr:exosortase/archaeosortase family protein [Akkermansia sp.]
MSTPPNPANSKHFFSPTMCVIIAISALILGWGYCGIEAFNTGYIDSAGRWIIQIWTDAKANKADHIWVTLPLMVYMLYQKKELIKDSIGEVDWKGLFLLIPACLLFIASFRVIQPRVTMFALPLIVLGAVWYLAGFRTAKICTIPILFFWLSIPLPAMQQSTTHLQILATQLGHFGGSLFGVDTIIQGTNIVSTSSHWESFSIAGGCSGMHSLFALIIISACWAYLSKLKLWKKLLFFLCTFPVAILGNGVRITSIVLIAEYINPDFASGTWHDWSGLLFFFPVCLICLSLIHSLLAGELIWKPRQKKQIVIRKNNAQ